MGDLRDELGAIQKSYRPLAPVRSTRPPLAQEAPRSRKLLVLLGVILAAAGAFFLYDSYGGSVDSLSSLASGISGETVTFNERFPDATPRALLERGGVQDAEAYDIASESFQVVVPDAAAEGKPHGLVVWISPGDGGALPDGDWGPILEKHELIWIAPNNAGNGRPGGVRMSLALDAVYNAKKKYKVDSNRIYIGGFSGGGKGALRTLLAFPEVFSGAFPCGGADYFRPLPAGGRTWPARYGRPSLLLAARQRPIALVSGTKDPNYPHIGAVNGGLSQDKFAYVRLFTEPEVGHSVPSAATLDRVITWLDGG